MKIPILNDIHEREGARLVEFAGWRMPVSFTSILKEATAVRNAAGLFDVTHMGRLMLKGPDALNALQNLATNDVSLLADSQGQYTLICNDRGGVVDDTIVYRKDSETFLIVVNASNTLKDVAWIQDHLEGRVAFEDLTEQTALFALQGPKAVEILRSMGLGEVESIRRFWYSHLDWQGKPLITARTGYTGEDGFEIACYRNDAVDLWESIMQAGESFGLQLCGLGARDVLRIEAAYPLYGNELDEFISPVEAGLMRFVKMNKASFIGKDAIQAKLEEPPERKLAGLMLEGRGVPRSGDSVLKDGNEIGTVTSGTWSPNLNRGIGMAYIVPEFAAPGMDIEIASKGRVEKGNISSLPFYSRGK